MAKTQRLATSISDRFRGSSYTDFVNTSTGPELTEEDVWSMVNDNVDHHNKWTPHPKTSGKHQHHKNNSSRRHHVGGLSLAFEQSAAETKASSLRFVQQFPTRECSNGSDMIGRSECFMGMSAPVNVSDWSKINRVDSVKSMMMYDEFDSDMMIPPHEYLARSRV